jgi:hypothetical protein
MESEHSAKKQTCNDDPNAHDIVISQCSLLMYLYVNEKNKNESANNLK